jgi:arylformamidase
MSQAKTGHKWIFLSYELSPGLSAYGNGQPVDIEPGSRISKGKSSNSSLLRLSSHYGTHIDFPRHFSDAGSHGGNYNASEFVFNHVKLIDISNVKVPDYLIRPDHLQEEKFDAAAELLLIKTGFSGQRFSDVYWEKNPGLDPGLAAFFKKQMPGIRAVGIDLISLSSWQKRDIGRKAHKEFLVNHQVLIIEDMDLSKVEASTGFERVIVSPLRFKDADGSPVTVFAQVRQENIKNEN